MPDQEQEIDQKHKSFEAPLLPFSWFNSGIPDGKRPRLDLIFYTKGFNSTLRPAHARQRCKFEHKFLLQIMRFQPGLPETIDMKYSGLACTT